MKKLGFTVLLFLLVIWGNAQGSLGFTSHATPGLADTVIKNSNITYGVTVMNTGNQPVSTNYAVIVAVYDTTFMFLDIVDSITISNNSFQPGDSSQVSITHNVDPLKFMDGNNTVVIWPYSPNYTTTDTIYRDVFVVNFENVDELSENQIIVYPNPTSDYIYIQGNFELENVRIYNAEGKEVYVGSNRLINVQSYTKGLYFFEVITKENKLIRRKVLVK